MRHLTVFPFLLGDSLGDDAYWAAGLHLYTPLPFRPAQGGLGDRFKTHLFLNSGNLVSLSGSMPLRFYDNKLAVFAYSVSLKFFISVLILNLVSNPQQFSRRSSLA